MPHQKSVRYGSYLEEINPAPENLVNREFTNDPAIRAAFNNQTDIPDIYQLVDNQPQLLQHRNQLRQNFIKFRSASLEFKNKYDKFLEHQKTVSAYLKSFITTNEGRPRPIPFTAECTGRLDVIACALNICIELWQRNLLGQLTHLKTSRPRNSQVSSQSTRQIVII